MPLQEINSLNKTLLSEALTRCCGSYKWVYKMCSLFPMTDEETLFKEATKIWYACTQVDWLEAFRHHPKIGDINSLKEKFAATADWAAGEQSTAQQTSQRVLEELSEGNQLYEEKFGYIFIVCATGKSAEEMLGLLQKRLNNEPEDEIKIAMEEQNKITGLRLEKLLKS